MTERPLLIKELDANTFREYYYLKEELVEFCRREYLQTTGGKIELTDRIAHYLETGERIYVKKESIRNYEVGFLTLDSYIEPNFVCSQTHREFFKNVIGNKFSFNVLFQNWLKENSGKTYRDAVAAYHQIQEDKKYNRTEISKQFEYNTYIRDFFDDNPGRSLNHAIACWKYKRGIPGHNRYEKSDLKAINNLGNNVQ